MFTGFAPTMRGLRIRRPSFGKLAILMIGGVLITLLIMAIFNAASRKPHHTQTTGKGGQTTTQPQNQNQQGQGQQNPNQQPPAATASSTPAAQPATGNPPPAAGEPAPPSQAAAGATPVHLVFKTDLIIDVPASAACKPLTGMYECDFTVTNNTPFPQTLEWQESNVYTGHGHVQVFVPSVGFVEETSDHLRQRLDLPSGLTQDCAIRFPVRQPITAQKIAIDLHFYWRHVETNIQLPFPVG